MHETIKFYDTVRFALSEKLALKTPSVLIKNDVFRCFCAIFQNDRRYGTIRYGTVRYGTIRHDTVQYGALKNSDKFALIVLRLK
jgi:hypothetical protein